jgi:hypothetical protein
MSSVVPDASVPVGTIVGYVRQAGTREPLQSAFVTLMHPDSGSGVRPVARALTDSIGSFRLAVPPGPWRLVVQRVGFRTMSLDLTAGLGTGYAADVSLAPSVLW